ncbi:S1 RNA-binding domain-containing protein 1 isoform X1 [Carcharodon carcharias]|uniref:S1 RNA-binding domain-containing protein 1 isoform X1 n=1 Tax=Carcharodon carcharias TaxID=13397 RepID=UPI001B7E6502|nr:S1 RNA-binding domain-containing protein 1 isoform X1 [Carcharodon carcharias]XP_041034541.1 S1 RNA-binding domain-containing protein 1 isoform X1 [Carcharodon carcharias]XP_041034550.1 S1 RNA-binding domain-containing protein 1 isoform X1 [Carcharodon carcharias]
MSGITNLAGQKRPFSEDDDSFLNITSESGSEEEEEEWVPKKIIARKPKKSVAKPVVVKKKVKSEAESTGTKRKSVKRSTIKTAVKKNRKKTPEKINVDPHVMALSPVLNTNEDKLPSQIKQNLGNMKSMPQQAAMQIKKEMEHCGIKVEQPSTSTHLSEKRIKEEADISFTWEEPALKKQKVENCLDGKPIKLQRGCVEIGDMQMNWNITQVLSERTNTEAWACANLIRLFKEENTIPFIARYRKELTNNMDADTLREVQQTLEELTTVIKKAHTAIQKVAKEEKLTPFLKNALLNCQTLEEVEHVFAPYKSGSKKTKAQQARQLGLEPAANLLIDSPRELNLNNYIKANVKGLSSVAEIETGIQHILADMISKDRETLNCIRKLCEQNTVFIQSTLTKTTAKEKDGNKKDTEKFRLYHNFSSSIGNTHHHQILAINRGEKLKILTVKVSIPDRVKNEFCRWCVNERWRPRHFARPEFMKLLKDSAEDSYKRLIYPLLCREFRSRLSSDAEKESIAMFGRNLRQLLLINPVRGRVLMGIDPGFRHGCKVSIISATSQILHTDVIYILGQGAQREAEKIRHLLHKYSCSTIVIGNGTACRETESFFADLINRKYFAPLDVVYCITSEAGASIYSVSPEAAKEMPDLDPNIRSAVSIARRVQDPLAELVKIEPKHIGVGMYQHDVSQTLLKATLDSVVEECVSFVGVDINISSETLMRHVAGLNASRAKNIIEWREKNGPFISREQLKQVKGLGPKTFQQCAGFIRINPENIKNFCNNQQRSYSTAGDQQAAEAGSSSKAGARGGTTGKPSKKKGKTQCTSVRPNPLDQTCIHPESYDTVMRFLSFINGNLSDIGRPAMQNNVNTALKTSLMDALAQRLDTTVPTLQMIIDGLIQPHDYDIRAGFEQQDFKRNIVSLNDLKNGTVLTGRVENATLFGVFVDIGVGRSGLIPIRYITAAKLPASKRRRSLGLGPGERVEVKVLEIDHARNRISLDLIRVL